LPGHQLRPAKVSRLMAFLLAEDPRLKKPVKKNIYKMLKISLMSFMIFLLSFMILYVKEFNHASIP